MPLVPDSGHHDQQHGQADDADHLGGDRRVVHPGGDAGRPDDQGRLDGQHDDRLECGAGRRVHLADQRLERDLDKAVVDRHGDDRQEGERHPAEPPADMHVGQPGRPLIGVPGQRHPGRERAVDQGDQRLSDGHDDPRPDGPRAARGEREAERGEDSGRDGDEGERDRERLEVLERVRTNCCR